MSRANNLAGQRFGNVVAVEPTPLRKNGYTIWKCLCDCGRTVETPSRYLKNGWTKACGDPDCTYSREMLKMQARHEDLTGKRFGKLFVRAMMPERSSTGQILWDCVCDCGNTVAAPTGQLKAGYRKSCGCLSRPPRKDWIGKTFGHLTVIAYDEKRDGKHYWRCRCDCGNETVVCQSNLMIGHTISCGCRNKPYEARTMVDGTCVEMIRNALEKKTIASNNSSGVRGVYKNKRTGRWCAQITFRGKTRYLGSYETLQEARIARERGEEIFEDFLDAYDSSRREGTGTRSNPTGQKQEKKIGALTEKRSSRPADQDRKNRKRKRTEAADSAARHRRELPQTSVGRRAGDVQTQYEPA